MDDNINVLPGVPSLTQLSYLRYVSIYCLFQFQKLVDVVLVIVCECYGRSHVSAHGDIEGPKETG